MFWNPSRLSIVNIIYHRMAGAKTICSVLASAVYPFSGTLVIFDQKIIQSHQKRNIAVKLLYKHTLYLFFRASVKIQLPTLDFDTVWNVDFLLFE